MTAFSERLGEYIKCSVTGESYNSYVPKPLPPVPTIEMEKLYPLLDRANIALGRLDGLSINFQLVGRRHSHSGFKPL